MNHYAYRAEWSAERDEYAGRCIELPFLSHWAPTMVAAMAGVERVVNEYLAERDSDDDPAPVPFGERRYSGNFMIRTSPALHARLAVEAAEQNVSMNHWVAQKLADRPPSSLLDW